MRTWLLLTITGCGSSVVEPSAPHSSVAVHEAAVGEPIEVTASWDGTCRQRAERRREDCRPEDHPISQCMEKQDYDVEVTCKANTFRHRVGCDPACVILDQRDPTGYAPAKVKVVALQAGRLTIRSYLSRDTSLPTPVTHEIAISEPDPGSAQLICYRAETTRLPGALPLIGHARVPCSDPAAALFAVRAATRSRTYNVSAVTVAGVERHPVETVDDADGDKTTVFAIQTRPARISFGGTTLELP